VLANTYGVILYQEQVMQIAQVLAGYTLGGADLLRRAMGKKKAEEMAQQRDSVFIAGASSARSIRPGWFHLRPDGEVRRLRLQQVALGRLRAGLLPDRLAQEHYPAYFMAAVLSADMQNTDKVGGGDLFGELLPGSLISSQPVMQVSAQRWSLREQLQAEKER
jgi:DNA polymerase-3 subunit alpha